MTTYSNNNSVYFPDDVWSIVKSYGGIYDMKTPISKMTKDIINEVYIQVEEMNENRGRRCPLDKNVSTKKKQLQRIYKYIWNYKIALYIKNVCEESKAVNLKCGDEVYVGAKKYVAGIITKINEYTIQVKPYILKEQIHEYPYELLSVPWCYKVQYYDKTKLGRAFSIHSQYAYKNENNGKIDWNDEFNSCFICNKNICSKK